jgi:hypothetical protein
LHSEVKISWHWQTAGRSPQVTPRPERLLELYSMHKYVKKKSLKEGALHNISLTSLTIKKKAQIFCLEMIFQQENITIVSNTTTFH